jgi:hypothetical protein
LKTAVFLNKAVYTHSHTKLKLFNQTVWGLKKDGRGEDWIYLPQVMDKWPATVHTVMKQHRVQ